MLLGEVVDQLLDQHGLADSGAAEQADLAALGVRREQVDDLDPGLEHLRRRRQVLDPRRRLVDAPPLDVGRQGLALVDRLAEQVEDPAERDLADRDRDRSAGVDHLHAPREAVGRVHRDRADAVVPEVLLDLEDEQAVAVCAGDRDRVVDVRDAIGEHGVDHDALDLLDPADVRRAGVGVLGGGGGGCFHQMAPCIGSSYGSEVGTVGDSR